MEVVADPQRLEARAFGELGLLHELGGGELLAGQEVAVGRHVRAVPTAPVVMPRAGDDGRTVGRAGSMEERAPHSAAEITAPVRVVTLGLRRQRERTCTADALG